MKWHRIRPGQYELRGSTGTRWGIIERSSMLPATWWWSVWGPENYATGEATGLVTAKAMAAAASREEVR